MKKIALISHGCAKNLVDSELILGILAEKGYKIKDKVIRYSKVVVAN